MKILPIVAALALLSASPTVPTLPDLLGRVHVTGCTALEHLPRDHSVCSSLRAEILAAAQRGALSARKHAFQEAAAIVRNAKDQKQAAEMLDRRASD